MRIFTVTDMMAGLYVRRQLYHSVALVEAVQKKKGIQILGIESTMILGLSRGCEVLGRIKKKKKIRLRF